MEGSDKDEPEFRELHQQVFITVLEFSTFSFVQKIMN